MSGRCNMMLNAGLAHVASTDRQRAKGRNVKIKRKKSSDLQLELVYDFDGNLLP